MSKIHWLSNLKLFHPYQLVKTVQSIYLIHWGTPAWFKSSMIYKASIFDYVHPIAKTFSFAKFVSSCKKSAHFINSFLWQRRFYSPETKKAQPIFDYHNPKIIKVTFSFSEFLSAHQKSVYSINSFLRYSQF